MIRPLATRLRACANSAWCSLEAGHFALDLKPKEIIGLTQEFMVSEGQK
jgi:hypothetical protein